MSHDSTDGSFVLYVANEYQHFSNYGFFLLKFISLCKHGLKLIEKLPFPHKSVTYSISGLKVIFIEKINFLI